MTYQEEVEKIADVFGISIYKGKKSLTAYPPNGDVFDASYYHFADAPLYENDLERTYKMLKDQIGTGTHPCADPNCECNLG